MVQSALDGYKVIFTLPPLESIMLMLTFRYRTFPELRLTCLLGDKLLWLFPTSFCYLYSLKSMHFALTRAVGSLWQVCIFAYGQTGSGKTYTMMGRPDAPELKGLIPRSLEQIFQASQSLKDQGWKYKMQVDILYPDVHGVAFIEEKVD